MPFIIDGYNLLRWVQKEEQFYTLDEAGLCRIVDEYFKQVRNHGQMIFDGLGPPDKSELAGFGNVEVYFSGMETEADDIIEDKILASTAPKNLVIVSTDRRIRAAANRRKSVSVRCDDFWPVLIIQLDRKKATPEPKGKRRGISEHEADLWLEEFGL